MSGDIWMQAIAWLAAGILGYTFAGYPLLLRFLTRGRSRSRPDSAPPADISIVIVARNAGELIEQRLADLRRCDYPGHTPPLIIVVSDASTDQTAALVRRAQATDRRIRLLEITPRGGKAAGINAGIRAAEGAIVIFTDVRQQFRNDTLVRLAAHFNDPRVGAVSGNLVLPTAEDGGAGGARRYWEYEKQIRRMESLLDSAIGCTGAVYAARRALLDRPLPTDTILDDVVIPMRIAMRGYRVLFDPQAVAYDPQPVDIRHEKLRKTRTLAGNFQLLFRYPGWLLPWRNRLWWQLLTHKYLRLTTPICLIAIAATSVALAAASPFYASILAVQVALYMLAGMGRFSRNRRLGMAAGLLRMAWMPLTGFWAWLTRRYVSGWESL